MVLSIMDTFKEWSEKLREWTISNTNNPLFWLCAFLLGILIFKVTYDSLHKD